MSGRDPEGTVCDVFAGLLVGRVGGSLKTAEMLGCCFAFAPPPVCSWTGVSTESKLEHMFFHVPVDQEDLGY